TNLPSTRQGWPHPHRPSRPLDVDEPQTPTDRPRRIRLGDGPKARLRFSSHHGNGSTLSATAAMAATLDSGKLLARRIPVMPLGKSATWLPPQPLMDGIDCCPYGTCHVPMP